MFIHLNLDPIERPRHGKTNVRGSGQDAAKAFGVFFYYYFIIICTALRLAAAIFVFVFLIWPPPRDLSIARFNFLIFLIFKWALSWRFYSLVTSKAITGALIPI